MVNFKLFTSLKIHLEILRALIFLVLEEKPETAFSFVLLLTQSLQIVHLVTNLRRTKISIWRPLGFAQLLGEHNN